MDPKIISLFFPFESVVLVFLNFLYYILLFINLVPCFRETEKILHTLILSTKIKYYYYIKLF